VLSETSSGMTDLMGMLWAKHDSFWPFGLLISVNS
jgi:hypothetical protein